MGEHALKVRSVRSDLVIHDQGPTHSIASFTNILIVVVAGEVTAPILRASVAGHKMVHGRYPSGIGVFVLVHGMPPIPGAEARKLSSEHIRSTAGEVLAQASHIDAEGFWASAARSAVTTINLLARAPNPTRVFGVRGEAIAWLAQYMAIGSDAQWSAGLDAAVAATLAGMKR